MLKNCTRCDQSKPLDLDHFPQRKSAHGWRWDSWCRDCYKANTRRIQTKDPERKRQKDKEWREKNSERYHAQARLRYAQMSVPEKQRVKDAARKHNRMLKLKALEAYGMFCECCGEGGREFLSIDHQFLDGKAHREALGGRTNGPAFYGWLAKRGYPKDLGLRTLCMNCNWASFWNNGICPHEIARQSLMLATSACQAA